MSKAEAKSACKSWQKKGGKWEFRAQEFGISKSKEENLGSDMQNPDDFRNKSEVASIHNINNGNERKNLTLLLWGNKKENSTKLSAIRPQGHKWIEYDLRHCREGIVEGKVIYGSEYKVKRGAKIGTTTVPSISMKKKFFYME